MREHICEFPRVSLPEGDCPYCHIAALEARIHEAKEIYTGMDGFIPETAPEGYQQRILKQMWEALTSQDQQEVACRNCYGTGKLYTPHKEVGDPTIICPECKGKKTVVVPPQEQGE